MKPLSSIFFTLFSVSLGLLFTSALSFNTFQFGGISILYFVTLYIFILQWIIFIPAYVKQTEHYFDLTGSMTYITSILLVTFFSLDVDLRDILISSLIAFFGTFLVMPSVIKLAIKKRFLVGGGGRNSHEGFTPNVGGLAIFSGLLLANQFLLFYSF